MLKAVKIKYNNFSLFKPILSSLAEKYVRENKVDISQVIGSGEKGKILIWDIKAHLKPLHFKHRKSIDFIHESQRKGKLSRAVLAGTCLGSSKSSHGVFVSKNNKNCESEITLIKCVHKESSLEKNGTSDLSTDKNSSNTSIKTQAPHFYVNTDCDLSFFVEASQKIVGKDFAFDQLAIKFILRCVAKSLQETPEFSIFSYKNKFYKNSGFKLFSCDMSDLTPQQIAKTNHENFSNMINSFVYFGSSLNISKITMPISEKSNFTLGVGSVVRENYFSPDGSLKKKIICDLTFAFDHQVIDGAIGAKFASKVKNYIQNPYQLA